MAMQLELVQSQAFGGSASRPRFPGISRACSLPPIRNINRPRSITANALQSSSQVRHSFHKISLFLLRPRHGPNHGTSRPVGDVTQASASKGNSWEHDEWSDYKPPKPEPAPAPPSLVVFVVNLVKKAIKLAGVILILSTAFAAATPAILSTSGGRKALTAMASLTIPGTVSVARASLGWRKPIFLEGITLKGMDGETTLSISKIETRASLWSVVRGKSGLGDATVSEPVLNLQQDAATGEPKLALALAPPSKLQSNSPTKNRDQTPAPVEPSKEVALAATFKAPGGGLEVEKGKVIVAQDVAATIGPSIFLEVALGRFATDGNEALKAAAASEFQGSVPVSGNLYSNCAQVEGLGFLGLWRGKVHLLRPIKAELDLTPEFGRLYLRRVNPLLGEVVGPAIGEEDLPDVTVYVAPSDFVLPSDEYAIRIEPLRTTLAKGLLVDGVLNLLSRQDLLKGRSQITALTSPIEAHINLKTGDVVCDRIDFLLADSVHVATWGVVNIHQETVQMTLAIPGNTLAKAFGLSNLGHDYHLKIPIRGTMGRLQVDFRAAAQGIGQLTLQQRTGAAGQLFSSFFQQTNQEASAGEVPKPIGVLPWDTRS